MGLIYLATPYSHEDPVVMESRFESVNRVAAKLMSDGLHIFSPISHTHPIAIAGKLPTGWEFWNQYDKLVISVCKGMIVLCLDGWLESVGVTAEIDIAKEFGVPIEYINEDLNRLVF
jgi:hypothetical protein